jgi:hypothetical protein
MNRPTWFTLLSNRDRISTPGQQPFLSKNKSGSVDNAALLAFLLNVLLRMPDARSKMSALAERYNEAESAYSELRQIARVTHRDGQISECRRDVQDARLSGRVPAVRPVFAFKCRCCVNRNCRENFEVGNIWLLKQDSDSEPFG